MAPKNKKKNGFFFYMKYVQEKEAAKGRRIKMSDLPDYCYAGWQQLSLVEREPYEEEARSYNKDPCKRGGKLASDGTRIEDNLRAIEDKKREETLMKNEIKAFLGIDFSNEEQFKEFASKKLLYFISFNILCETETEVIPIEVGLVEYSISNGIHQDYHTIINPGPIPTGYAGEAKRKSEEKHEINIFGKDAPINQNLAIVYEKILDFVILPDTDSFSPVFTLEDDLRITKGCMEFLRKRAGSTEYLKVWNSKYLLMDLRAGCGEALPSPFIAADLLTKTCFNYYPGSRCDFHEEKDCYNCALAYSLRLCYLLSDAVCGTFNVIPTENHMPPVALEERSILCSSSYDRPRVPAKGNPIRVNQRSTYHESPTPEPSELFRPPTRSETPRQPTTHCIAAEMSRLKLGMPSATVPGHGLGRGQRRVN